MTFFNKIMADQDQHQVESDQMLNRLNAMQAEIDRLTEQNKTAKQLLNHTYKALNNKGDKCKLTPDLLQIRSLLRDVLGLTVKRTPATLDTRKIIKLKNHKNAL